MLVRKVNPIGIDKIIDSMQVKLDGSVLSSTGSWDNFPRAYKNPKASNSRGYIPECYDENGEYIEVLMNDKVTMTTFFIQGDGKEYIETQLKSDFSLIVQCSDLVEKFPSVVHRADEELIHLFLDVLKNTPGVKIESIELGIDDVYREFDKSNLKLDDMGYYFVFRINMTTNYGVQCCDNC